MPMPIRVHVRPKEFDLIEDGEKSFVVYYEGDGERVGIGDILEIAEVSLPGEPECAGRALEATVTQVVVEFQLGRVGTAKGDQRPPKTVVVLQHTQDYRWDHGADIRRSHVFTEATTLGEVLAMRKRDSYNGSLYPDWFEIPVQGSK